MDRETFFDILDAIELLIQELDISPDKRTIARSNIEEMKFCACFSSEFRRDTYPDLEEFLSDLYERVNE